MEEEFEEIEVEYACIGGDEIDPDYEFDAPRFFDFTRLETFLDAAEAEQWFEFAESYPPSPFLMKLRWGNAGAMESVDEQVSGTEDNNNERGLESNGETKSLSKSSSSLSSKSKVSSFMKPTASHLAKHKNPTEVPTPRRFEIQSSSPSVDSQLTKRQRLEAGYLRKVAHLKHQALFTHKKPTEADPTAVNVASRPKATVPKEPNLVTALRAQRHKSKMDAESGGNTKSSSQVFKARPLNKKVLVAPTQSLRKKKTPRVTEFNVFHLKTSERAMQNTSRSSNAGGSLNSNSVSTSGTRDPKRTNSSHSSRQEKCRMVNKLRGSPDDKQFSSKGERGVFKSIKVFPLEPNDSRSINEPPMESFSKLSLGSEVKQTTKPSSKEQPISKGLKENRPGSMHQEREMNLAKEETQRLCGKQYQFVKEMESFISKQNCMLASRAKSKHNFLVFVYDAIVLKLSNYADSSTIMLFFTQELGH